MVNYIKENIIKLHKNGLEIEFPLKIFFFFSLNKYIYLMDVYPRIHQIILNQPIALDIWIVIVLKG